jgi:hypothetical protein
VKKPYNPILGEVFNCSWKVYGENVSGNKPKEASLVTYKSEQVSHNPASKQERLRIFF